MRKKKPVSPKRESSMAKDKRKIKPVIAIMIQLGKKKPNGR